MKNCKFKWWEWRKSGAVRDPADERYTAMTRARKSLRKEKRQESARYRKDKVEEIMNAQNDSKTFHKVINEQRKISSTQTQSVVVDGKPCETAEEICSGWSTHFQKIATPLEKASFDAEYKAQVDSDIENITSLCETERQPIKTITEKEVCNALRKLKNNKAMDDYLGLTGEHFKLGGRDLISFLTDFLNHTIYPKHISVTLKEDMLTPIYKKSDVTDPGNYRGITVTPVLLKILERVLNSRHNEILAKTQSKLSW